MTAAKTTFVAKKDKNETRFNKVFIVMSLKIMLINSWVGAMILGYKLARQRVDINFVIRSLL